MLKSATGHWALAVLVTMTRTKRAQRTRVIFTMLRAGYWLNMVSYGFLTQRLNDCRLFEIALVCCCYPFPQADFWFPSKRVDPGGIQQLLRCSIRLLRVKDKRS